MSGSPHLLVANCAVEVEICLVDGMQLLYISLSPVWDRHEYILVLLLSQAAPWLGQHIVCTGAGYTEA